MTLWNPREHCAPITFFLGVLLLAAPAAQAAPFAYIANTGSGTVSVIDTASNAVTATVTVGLAPQGVAVNAAGTRVYVANANSNTVSVIDTTSNTVTATVPVGTGNGGVAVNPAGTRVYVASSFGNSVSVMDTASNTVIATVPVGRLPHGVAVNPAGTQVYVANESGTVSVIDTATNTVTATVAAEVGLRGVAVNPSGTRVYVANLIFNTVSVIDTASNTVIATVPVGTFPTNVAVNPAGTRVYVTNNGSADVSVIDTTSNTVTTTVTVGISPIGVAVNRAGTQVYVANLLSNNVSVIETGCNTVTATVAVGTNPSSAFGLFIGPGGEPPPVAGPTTLRITGMEVTQGIQDLANSVLLVSGRRTFVRVYVQSDGPAVPGVTAALRGSTPFCLDPACTSTIDRLLGSLVPVNTVGPRITVGPNPRRSILDESFLFELPWDWTNVEALSLHAVLTEDAEPPARSCPEDFASAPLHEFRPPTYLSIQFIRLAYPVTATTNAEASTSERDQSESFIRRTYPVSGLSLTPDARMFDAGLTSRVERTADECKDLKTADKDLCANNYISNRLAALEASSGVLGLRRSQEGPAGSTQIVGAVDGAYALIPQHPVDTIARFTRGACCVSRVGAGPSNSVDYAGHEIGHLFGRQHPVAGSSAPNESCGHDAVDPNYPYPGSFIAHLLADPDTGLAGFDGGDASLLPPIPMSHISASTYDNVGYCKPAWISDYTYRNLYSCLLRDPNTLPGMTPGCGQAGGAGPAGSQSGDWLLAFGSINSDPATASFIQTQRVDRVVSVPPRAPGDHSIRLIGAGGVTLADYPFTPEAVEDTVTTEGGSPLLRFGHVVPFVAGTQEIRIVDASAGSSVIGAKTVSASPPTISNVALQVAPDPVTGSVTAEWTASDPDGDLLTFDVFFTHDGGESLQPLMLGLSGTSVPIDTAPLGGGIAQLRVVATDGVQSAFADSPPFTLADKPPVPRIRTPADGTTIHVGQLVNLEGEATDPQDGVIPDTGLAWSTPGQSLGSGARLSITDLPVGVSQVTLTATNSLGLAATTSASVTVEARLDLPGPTLIAGPGQIGWNVGPGESQLQTAVLDIGNSGSGNLAFTAQSGAAWLTLSAATGTAPATLTVTADPSTFPGGVTEDLPMPLPPL